MKTILVPTDFSEPAQWATEAAISIAKKASATVVLLHVVEQSTEGAFAVEEQIQLYEDRKERLYMEKLIEKSRAQLNEVIKQVKDSGVNVMSELWIGNAFQGIHGIIHDYHVDLVVIGTAGKTKFEEAPIGSNAEKVVRYSACAVLAITEKPGEINFKNIVYASSLSDGEKLFSKMVMKAQKMYASTIHLVRVNTPPNFQPDLVVKQKMGVFASNLGMKNYTINTFSDYEEGRGITDFAKLINADVIAMATHGRTGLAHLLERSVAENVVNRAAKPVLTFVIKDF